MIHFSSIWYAWLIIQLAISLKTELYYLILISIWLTRLWFYILEDKELVTDVCLYSRATSLKYFAQNISQRVKIGSIGVTLGEAD